MKYKFFSNKRQAQQLVEFAIVVPILMIIVFIVVELGAAINARVTIAEAVKASLIDVNKLTSLNGDTTTKEAEVESLVKSRVIQYLLNHNIPNSGSVDARVTYNAANNTAVAFVSYQYVPYFLLAGLVGTSVSSIPFSSSQTLNPSVFKPNAIPAGPTTEELSQYHINGTLVDSGALVDTTTFNYGDATFNVREQIAFLLRMYEGEETHPYFQYDIAHARLVDWVGNDLLPPNLRINLRTGTLEVKSPYYRAGTWFDTKVPYIWVVSALGFNHLIYIKYNTDQMKILDTVNIYKLLLNNNSNSFYNKEMFFCGPVSGFGCATDLRDTATINERALRMNPRLGESNLTSTYTNVYIIGAVEPIIVDTGTIYKDFAHVKGFYFSYTTDYANWDAANWEDQYFVTISSPRVFGLQDGTSDMGDGVYLAGIEDNTRNPFYRAYQYQFQLSQYDKTNPGALNGSGTTYTVDIVDVYIDSDGDGIPDAWDDDPEYFDVNVNGRLDGQEDTGVNMWTQTRCRDDSAVGICASFRDDSSDSTGTATITTGYSPSGSLPIYISTPYDINDNVETNHTARYLPEFTIGDFVLYDHNTNGPALYYNTGGASYSRVFPTWWDKPPANRRQEKVNGGFVHGSLGGASIRLSPSIELQYLYNNTFSPGNYVKRTPPTVW